MGVLGGRIIDRRLNLFVVVVVVVVGAAGTRSNQEFNRNTSMGIFINVTFQLIDFNEKQIRFWQNLQRYGFGLAFDINIE